MMTEERDEAAKLEEAKAMRERLENIVTRAGILARDLGALAVEAPEDVYGVLVGRADEILAVQQKLSWVHDVAWTRRGEPEVRALLSTYAEAVGWAAAPPEGVPF